jgi:hypothetical protein
MDVKLGFLTPKGRTLFQETEKNIVLGRTIGPKKSNQRNRKNI